MYRESTQIFRRPVTLFGSLGDTMATPYVQYVHVTVEHSIHCLLQTQLHVLITSFESNLH